MVISDNATGLPKGRGPHGVDLDAPRGATRYRQLAPFARTNKELRRYVASRGAKL